MALHVTTAAGEFRKPLVVCPHRELSSRIQEAFAELGLAAVTCLSEYPRMGQIVGMIAAGQADVCFLDVASNSEHAMLLLAEASAVVPVVALNTRKDADLILRCLHGGAVEFLADPAAGQLRAVLEHLERRRTAAAPPKPSTVYCVVPGKPGCGASTLALHLALELKQSGAASVLLVDTDIRGGTLAFLLKLKPEFHVGDAVRDRQRLDADLWGRLAIPYRGIDLLPAPENSAVNIEFDQASAAGLLDFWRERYEAIVVDTAGAQPAMLELARLSDHVLLVVTNELIALHASRRSIEYLEQNAIDRRRLRLVVNRYAPSPGLQRDEIQTALRLDPYILLANEYETVQQAVLEGRPVAAGTRFDRGLRALAARLTGKEAPADKKAGWLSLLPGRT